MKKKRENQKKRKAQNFTNENWKEKDNGKNKNARNMEGQYQQK